MTDHQFYVLWGEALKDGDRDIFVSDWGTSSMLLPEDGEDIPADLIQAVGRVWDLAHMSVADLRAKTGLSQAAFAERFCIPRRTVESWESKSEAAHRDCPDYVRLLLARVIGL